MTAKLQVQLEALIGTYFSDLTRAADKLQDFQAKAQRAGTALTAAFTLPLTLFGRQAVKSGAELDGLNRSMTAIEGTAEKAGKRIAVLNEIAKLPGLNFKDAVQGDVNLRSAGLSAELAAKSMSAFGNALGILGKQGGLGNVNQQIQQMATKTQGFGADLKILKEWVPQVGTALQQAFGTTNADMIATMGITGKEAIEKIVNELAKLPKATGGLGNALENLDDAWFKFTGKIGLAIEKSIGLSSMIDKLSAGLTDLASWFENLDPGVQKLIIGFFGVVASTGPLLLLMSGMPTLFAAIGGGATLLAGLFSGPLVAAFVGAGIALVAIKEYWWDTKSELEKTQFLDDLRIIFKRTFETIYHGMASFKSLMVGDWNALEDHMYNAGGRLYQFFSNISAKLWSKMQSVLGSVTFGGLSKFFDASSQQTLKQLEELNTRVNKDLAPKGFLGNNLDVNRRPDLNTKKGGAGLIGGAGAGTADTGTNYYQQMLEDEAYKKSIADKIAFYENDKSFQDKLKLQAAGTWSVIGKTAQQIATTGSLNFESFAQRSGEALNKLSEKIKSSPISRPLGAEVQAINEMISLGADNAIVGMAEWVGAFSVGAKSFKDLGSLMKGIFGDIMITIGKQMITTSEAFIAFKKAIMTSGVGGLAIGLALVAAGSALKASASKSSGASYQQVPQSSVGNYQPIYTPYNTPTGASGAKVSIEINQGQTIQRGADIYTTQANYIYDKGR